MYHHTHYYKHDLLRPTSTQLLRYDIAIALVCTDYNDVIEVSSPICTAAVFLS